MTIRPLHSVNDIAFGASRTALSHLGQAVNQGGREVVLAGMIYRFLADSLVEVSFRVPQVMTIDGQPVQAGSLVAFLKQHDPGFREAYGFAIAPSLGLAVDTEHEDRWVTAFVSGRWDHII